MAGAEHASAYLKASWGYVGAIIHGWLITAWSLADIFGPVLVNYIREYDVIRAVRISFGFEFPTGTRAFEWHRRLRAVMDAEVVCLKEKAFQISTLHRRTSDHLAVACSFDLLMAKGGDLRRQPLRER